ncbi:MAG: hypothetical protein HUU20_17415 [Pirellulales bacterium]|nr:hypothetical protein [Pirellulales bacterium]
MTMPVAKTRRGRRRGVAVLVVLLLISVTLAVSYVSMRSQTTASIVERNANLRDAARQAAMTGLAAALKKMQSASWGGVGTMLVQSLGSGQRFEVSFAAGDARLAPGDPDYSEYPYRVTLLATGYASDPSAAGSLSSHVIRAVVRLVPRKLSDAPAGWSEITSQTFCQWERGDFSLTVPFRIEGPVRIRAKFDLSDDQLNWSDDVLWWYMTGLNWLRLAGQPDWRPLTGPVCLNHSGQDSDTLALMRTGLGLTTQDASNSAVFRWSEPVSSKTYRLYPGGKSYNVVDLPRELRGVSLEPDPETNPLGIFWRNGTLAMHEDVTIRGTVMTAGSSNPDIHVYGANVRLLPLDLPPLEDLTATAQRPVRLPTIVSADDMTFHDASRSTIEGLVMVADNFNIDEAPQSDTSISIRGKVAAKDVDISRRSPWNQLRLWWDIQFNLFLAQYQNAGGIPTFPIWLQKHCGLDPEPRMVIRPDDKEILYHWQNANNPIYVPHPDDASPLEPGKPGLRWELLDWVDNPQS